MDGVHPALLAPRGGTRHPAGLPVPQPDGAPLPLLRWNPVLRLHVGRQPLALGRPLSAGPADVRLHTAGHLRAPGGRRDQPHPGVAVRALDETGAVRRRMPAPGRELESQAHGPAQLTPLDFELSEEQRAVRDLCREFAREVVAPAADELDREHRFPYDIVRQMGELGVFGLPFPEEWGGAGADFLSYCLAIEEVSRADAGVGITLEAAVSLGAAPIHDFGTPEQKQEWLPDLLAGRRLWAFGLTE